MMKIKICLVTLISVVSNLTAQNNHAKGLGFADSYISPAMGIDAFFLNPANLAFHEKGIEFTFLSPSVGIANSAFSAADYGRYFTKAGHKGKWPESDKKEIKDLLSEGIDVPFNLDMNIFSMVYRNMGFGIGLVGGGGINTEFNEVAEVALYGDDLVTNYQFGKDDIARGFGYAAMRFSFAYGQTIRKRYFPWNLENISVGGRLSYYAGISGADLNDGDLTIRRLNASQTMDDDVVEIKLNGDINIAKPGDGVLFPGSGFGIDLAGSATYNEDWHFSVLLENFIGYINWDENVENMKFTQYDSSYIFNDDGVDRSIEVDTVIKGKSFETNLPFTLQIGAHYQLLKNLMLTAHYKQGFSDAITSSYIPQLGAGAEYRPLKWLPLRMGMTIGGVNDFLLGLGAGVDVKIFEFNLAYAMRESLLWPNYATGAFVAMDFKFKL